MKIDAEVGRKIINEKSYDKQRNINWDHVNFLSTQMKKDRFDPDTARIAFGIVDKKEILVDGYHRILAIINSNLVYEFDIKYHHCENDTDLANVYSRYDIGRSRTIYDGNRAHRIDEETGLKSWQINKIGAALRFIKKGFPRSGAGGRLAGEDFRQYIREWQDEGKAFFGIVSSISFEKDDPVKGRILIVPVVSVSLVLLRYCPKEASEFIYHIGENNGLKKGDPRRTFNIFLARGINRNIPKTAIHYPGYIARGMTFCWQKWMAGDIYGRIDIKSNHLLENIKIYNTPFDGSIKTLECFDD